MIVSITRDWGVEPSMVRIHDTVNNLQQVADTNYLLNEALNIQDVNNGNFDWDPSDTIRVSAVDGAADFTLSLDQNSLLPMNNQNKSTQNLTAEAGGGQTGATQLNSGNNTVSTVATAGDSTVLPSDVDGQTITVTNTSANSLNVYPANGDTINSLAANAPLAVAAGATIVFYGVSDSNWRSK